MRFAIPVAAAFLLGFLVSHGTETPVDLFVLMTSIVIVYAGIGLSEVLQTALARPRRVPPAEADTQPIRIDPAA